MKIKPLASIAYPVCFIGMGTTFWISWINLEEIGNRANGHYTFYSQRATLTDDSTQHKKPAGLL